MAQNPTTSGGQSQTLLELIFALKGLAQTVEFYHKDLSQRLEEEGRARTRELGQLQKVIEKNQQALSVLPITISDRVEKLFEGVDERLTIELKEVQEAVMEVRQRLWKYMKVTERAISQTGEEGAPDPVDEKAEITGKMEVTEDGSVRVLLNSKLLKNIWRGILVLAAGGGAFGLKELIQSMIGG